MSVALTQAATKRKRLQGSGAKRGGWLGLALSSVLLVGCAGGLGGGTPTTIYDLAAPASVNTGGAATRRQLLVPLPKAVRALDTDQIVVRSDGSQLSYYPNVVWSDTVPKLVQTRLIETLERTGNVRAVSRPGQGFLTDVQIIADIRAFELVVDQGPDASRIVIAVQLMNDANGRIIASRTFEATARSASDNPDQAVDAFEVAMQQVLSDMAVWILRRV